MHAISTWLKQVVLLVLLATLIDLLLPNQALSRYVKLVMGLLIILAILNPILAVLNDRFQWEELTWERLQPWLKRDVPSLAEIKQQSEEMKAWRQKQTIDTWRGQVAHMMKQDLKKRFALRVDSLRVEAEWRNQTPTLTRVELIATMEERPTQSAPLQPVEIGKSSSQQKASALQKKVSEYFRSVWHMDHPVVQIRTS